MTGRANGLAGGGGGGNNSGYTSSAATASGGVGGGGVDPSPLLGGGGGSHNYHNTTSSAAPSTSSSVHLRTYTAGEDSSRLASAAKSLGLAKHRPPRKPVRIANVRTSSKTETERKHGWTTGVLDGVGELFSDRILEYATLHAVDSRHLPEYGHADSERFRRLSAEGGEEGRRLSFRDSLEAPLAEQPPVGDPHAQGVGGSISAAIFGTVKAMVGPAILYLPHGFSTAGYMIAVPIIFATTAMYLYSARCLMDCWRVETYGLRIGEEFDEDEDMGAGSRTDGERLSEDVAGEEELVRLMERISEEGTTTTTAGPRVETEMVSGGGNGTKEEEEASAEEEVSKKKKYGSTDRFDVDEPLQVESGLSSSPEQQLRRPTMPMALSYPELAYRSLGPTGEKIVMTGIALMQFGVVLTYLIFVPQNLHTSLLILFNVHVPLGVLLIIMVVMEIPLSWIRDIRKLTYTNIAANFLILYGLITCLGFAINGTMEDGGFVEKAKALSPISEMWYLFIGTSVLLFEGSITLLVPLQEAVQTYEDRTSFPKVYNNVILSIIGFYCFFGLTCWMAFGDDVRTVLTTSLPEGYLATSVQFAYSVAVIFTFPLQNFPALEITCRSFANCFQSYVGKDSILLTRSFVSSTLVCLLAAIAYIEMNSLGNVVSLMGSLLGCPIAFVFPPLIHNGLVKNLSRTRRNLNYIVSALGVISMVAASVSTIVTWGDSAGG